MVTVLPLGGLPMEIIDRAVAMTVVNKNYGDCSA